jgi:hypothetical protein
MAFQPLARLDKDSARAALPVEGASRQIMSSLQQRVFHEVLNENRSIWRDEQESGVAPGSPEVELLGQLGEESSRLTEVRSQVAQAADRGDLQPLITAAYIRAAAMGSGAAVWESRVSGLCSVPPAVSASPSAAEEAAALGGEPAIGMLSSLFESGTGGVGAIGYDPRGGTSYGLYQIASGTGSMDRFLTFLETRAPHWAKRLEGAGPADTGSREGRMPREWRRIASEDPARFASIQHEFIRETHYEPALESIYGATGLRLEERSRALREVAWSAAVQHGPAGATAIFEEAVAALRSRGKPVTDPALIEEIYTARAKRASLFSGGIQKALYGRFREEKKLALALAATEAKA